MRRLEEWESMARFLVSQRSTQIDLTMSGSQLPAQETTPEIPGGEVCGNCQGLKRDGDGMAKLTCACGVVFCTGCRFSTFVNGIKKHFHRRKCPKMAENTDSELKSPEEGPTSDEGGVVATAAETPENFC